MTVRVLITLEGGEHRVHLRGDLSEVSQLAEITKSHLFLRNTTAVASGPEKHWREIEASWRNNGSALALNALSLIRDERRDHLLKHPDCAYRNPGEGRPKRESKKGDLP